MNTPKLILAECRNWFEDVHSVACNELLQSTHSMPISKPCFVPAPSDVKTIVMHPPEFIELVTVSKDMVPEKLFITGWFVVGPS